MIAALISPRAVLPPLPPRPMAAPAPRGARLQALPTVAFAPGIARARRPFVVFGCGGGNSGVGAARAAPPPPPPARTPAENAMQQMFSDNWNSGFTLFNKESFKLKGERFDVKKKRVRVPLLLMLLCFFLIALLLCLFLRVLGAGFEGWVFSLLFRKVVDKLPGLRVAIAAGFRVIAVVCEKIKGLCDKFKRN